jgi:RNA polymerase sigma-70 factor, ECF subfamily
MDDLESAVGRMRTGDAAAFEAIFREYERMVYRTACFLTGDKETAADVTQDVFVSVWKYRRTYDPKKAGFTTWLHRITINRCNKTRAKDKNDIPLDALDEDSALLAAPGADSPEEMSITREEYRTLLTGLMALDRKHRTVMVLRFFDDLSYNEIAEAVHIPLGTVKSRLSTALKQVSRQFYDKECER